MLFILQLFAGVQAQWCCLDSTFVIEDLDTRTLRITVSGALNNDLASPDQGLCGVRIRFDHKYIGDLTMTLVSPSGQRVGLLGPTGNSGYTFFSRWDVKFVNCFDQAIPDQGYDEKWDNIQSWGVFGQFYNGTYYPQMGCLEDFDFGPVNGVWNLEITDHQRFQTGQVYQVCLLFCDVKNTSCISCSPNGGFFDPKEMHFCLGNDSLDRMDWIIQSNYKPDSNIYDFKYLVAKNDSILQITETPDLSTYGTGNYKICGLSYLTSDSSSLPSTNQDARLSQIRSEVILNSKGICAEFSKNCLDVVIHPLPSTLDTNITICRGDTFEIYGSQYFADGQYQLKFINENGCDSFLRFNLKTVELKAEILGPIDDITCHKDTVTLDASISTYGAFTRFSWATENGNIADSSDTQRVKVNKQGFYQLTLQEGLCKDTIGIFVNKISEVPELHVKLDTITCLEDTAHILAITNVVNPKWEWRDNNNQLVSDSSHLNTNLSGRYVVSLEDTTGCKVHQIIVIPLDTASPRIMASDIVKPCSMDSILVSFESLDSLISIEWTGPNQFYSFSRRPFIQTEGEYHLKAIGVNGCSSEIKFSLIHQESDLLVILDSDTLSCEDTLAEIRTTFNKSFKKIEWNGPNNYSSMGLDALVAESGIYTIVVTDYNDCIVTDSIFVPELKSPLSTNLSASKISCLSDSVQLLVEIFPQGAIADSIFWIGSNFTSNNLEPWIRERGWYKLFLWNSNGCLSVDSIFVDEDNGKPDVLIISDTLNCLTDSVQLIAESNLGIDFSWIGPNNFRSINKNPFVFSPGLYELTVESANGCQTKRSVFIPIDTISPFIRIVPDTLTCLKKSVELRAEPMLSTESIIWRGPFNFNSNLPSAFVSNSGIYYLTVTSNVNGCLKEDSIFIPIDTLLPQYQVVIDSITCSRSKAEIRLTSSKVDDFVEWLLPNGDTIVGKTFQSEFLGLYRFKIASANGCEVWDSILMKASIEKPEITMQADTITCRTPMVRVDLLSPSGNLFYRLIRPDKSEDSTSFIITDQAGWHIGIARNQSDCITIDSIWVEDRSKPTSVVFFDSNFDCLEKDSAILFVEGVTMNDSLIWTFPDGLFSSQRMIQKPAEGKYFLKLTNQFGCISLDSVVVTYDTLLQFSSWMADTLTCDKKMVQIFPSIGSNSFTMTIIHPDTFIQTTSQPIYLVLPGLYQIEVIGSNHCKLDTSINIQIDTTLPNVLVEFDTITCNREFSFIELLSTDSIVDVSWILADSTEILGRSFSTNIPGKHSYSLKNRKNGCLLNGSIIIPIDTLVPEFLISQLDSINCDSLPIRLEIISKNNLKKYRYNWSTVNGMILDRSDTSLALVIKGGRYFVTATDESNGCVSNGSIDLSVVPEPITSVDFGIIQDLCVDSAAATIEINVRQGGTIPFSYSIDGVNFTMDSRWFNLRPGNYHFHVKDGNGCSYDTIYFVPNQLGLHLDVLQDTTVNQGVPVVLKSLINKDSSSLTTILWSPMDYLSCSDCLNNISIPDQSINYIVTVIDTNGCIATDEVRITVLNEVNVYWPNAFTPNGDQIHDEFYLQLDESVKLVNDFQIYDRWGNRIYGISNLVPHSQKISWDGTFLNRNCLPGVYVFVLEFETNAGERIQRTGEFTLIR